MRWRRSICARELESSVVGSGIHLLQFSFAWRGEAKGRKEGRKEGGKQGNEIALERKEVLKRKMLGYV